MAGLLLFETIGLFVTFVLFRVVSRESYKVTFIVMALMTVGIAAIFAVVFPHVLVRDLWPD